MREITKEIKFDVDGREMTFQIRKFDVLKATYVAKLAIEKIVPIFTTLEGVMTPIPKDIKKEEIDAIVKERTAKVMDNLPSLLSKLTEDELNFLMKRCLQHVDVLLPAGWQPVMIGDKFGVDELEYDEWAALRLFYEVLEFNLGSFFGGKNLSSILNRLNSFLPSA